MLPDGSLVYFPWISKKRMGLVKKQVPPIDGRDRVMIDNELCYFVDELTPVERVIVNTAQYTNEKGTLTGHYTWDRNWNKYYYYDVHLDIFPADNSQWFDYNDIEGLQDE